MAVFFAAAFNGCGKEDQKKDFLARVENSYLTKENMASDIDTIDLQDSRRNEYLHNWVETEMLYKEAQKEDITKEAGYLRALEQAKRELARSMLLRSVLDKARTNYKENDLQKYYNDHKDDFRLSYDSFLYNTISFNDENKAILFRSTLIETDWNKAINAFGKDAAVINYSGNLFRSDYQIEPNNVYLVIGQLLEGEVSIVMNTEPGVYTVVQVIKKIGRNEIPDFPLIKNKVKERVELVSRRAVIKDYIKKLYDKYKVEIKQRP